jgi:ubiquinone/menaquinone biosynthesis C-methylase UbiE
MMIMLEGRLNLAPIGRNPQNVLDIGTGTGIWAIDFGITFFESTNHENKIADPRTQRLSTPQHA